MKVCFVRWHKIFVGWLFLIQLFFALALKAVSVAVQSDSKNCPFKARQFEVRTVAIRLQLTS